MLDINLVGFSKKAYESLMPKIAERIRATTDLADKTNIMWHPNNCVLAVDINKPMRPYFSICNDSEGGTDEEFELLTEILKSFGHNIRWVSIKIKKSFPAPDFNKWGV